MPCARVGESVEADAIRGIQRLNTAQAEYASRFGEYGRVDDLLTRAPDIGTTVNAVINNPASRYRFRVSRTVKGYTVVARPIRPEYRTSHSDETLVIGYGRGEAAAGSVLR
jgi:hypothetical protein